MRLLALLALALAALGVVCAIAAPWRHFREEPFCPMSSSCAPTKDVTSSGLQGGGWAAAVPLAAAAGGAWARGTRRRALLFLGGAAAALATLVVAVGLGPAVIFGQDFGPQWGAWATLACALSLAALAWLPE